MEGSQVRETFFNMSFLKGAVAQEYLTLLLGDDTIRHVLPSLVVGHY